MAELEVKIPSAEFVPVEALRVDNENPNRLSPRRFEALKKSIQRFGFVVPIITNRELLVADGEHRLEAAKALGMKQVSIVRLPVDEVDRRLIRQVMNKLRGEPQDSKTRDSDKSTFTHYATGKQPWNTTEQKTSNTSNNSSATKNSKTLTSTPNS